ncbi:MAG: hypothetical protein JWP02_2467 [Acidimicrobiales bacterium]|nr:hypothetical protein [Acidimicrobiales bacterium]
MEREGRIPPAEDELDDDLSLEWSGVDDPASEGADDVLDVSDSDDDEAEAPHPPVSEVEADPARAVPWDEMAEDRPPTFEGSPPLAPEPAHWGLDEDEEDDADVPLFEPEDYDEEPPQGDPIEAAAEAAYEPRPATARIDSLQDALSSIRERVQSLSSSMKSAEATTGRPRTSELSLYRQATDDRTLRELQRHSGETEELLRRMSTLMQDLSLDLRSIVDAARRAIDQTSEQAESSVELGRLLSERIEQLDQQLGARLDLVDDAMAGRLDQMDSAVGKLQSNVGSSFSGMQAHLDKRLSKLEQRSGVGIVREELGEVRSDVGEVRADLTSLRDEVAGAVAAPSEDAGGESQERLEAVADQLDRTLRALNAIVEAEPASDDAALDEVLATIKAETEASVAPFRDDIEDLGRQLTSALDREEQLTVTLASLTEEVRGLRKRIAVRATPPTIGDDQIQNIVDAVVAALPGRRAAARAARVETEEEAEAEVAAALESTPPSPSRRRRSARGRSVRAEVHPLDVVNEDDEELPDVEFPSSVLGGGEDAEEEPIRRARGAGGGKAKAKRPAVKGRRARSGPP